jgi:hypothetical protein
MHSLGSIKPKKKIKSIEQVQKRAARFVHSNYRHRTSGCVTNIVKSLKWENLEDRRKSTRLSMLFKIQHELIDTDRQQYLMPNDNRTRGKNCFYQERSKTDIYRQSFFPKTIRDCNKLPANTTSAATIEGFRAALMSSSGRN